MRGDIFMGTKPVYDRTAAIAYAHRHAFTYNSAYYNFDKLGGDCTNFISQCLYAGFPQMNYSKNGWYYKNAGNRSPAWTGVQFLYAFLVSSGKRPGPSAAEIPASDAVPGDVIQLSFDGIKFSHSLFVVEKGERGILIATHSDDSDYRALDSYNYRFDRGLHIL